MISSNLKILGLSEKTSWEQIELQYRVLVKKWHPDRYHTDESLRAFAEDKTKEINAAYESLKKTRYRTATDTKIVEESSVIKNKKFRRKRRLTFYREFKPSDAIDTHEHYKNSKIA